jgi:hypothetical protein
MCVISLSAAVRRAAIENFIAKAGGGGCGKLGKRLKTKELKIFGGVWRAKEKRSAGALLVLCAMRDCR